MRLRDFLTLDELAQLKSACTTDRERAILLILAGTGIRVNELINLKVEHIDFECGYSKLGAHGEQSRICIIPMPVIKAISAHLQGRHIGYVFEGRKDGHLSTRQVQRIIDEIAQRAGLQKESLVKQRNRKRINQHMLRYSAARWWLDCGIHIGEVARQLGLSCLQIDGRYIEKHHNQKKTSFERAEIYEPLMFKTKERLDEFSGDEDRLNELRQAKIKENTKNDAEPDILAELKNSWSKISYED